VAESQKLAVSCNMISELKTSQVWELCRMCAGSTASMIPIFNEDGSDKDDTAYKLNNIFSVNVTKSHI
jgi:hypothetical protein